MSWFRNVGKLAQRPNLEQDEEIALIQALRDDRMGALKALHERFYSVLWLYAQKYVPDSSTAADLTQETFLNFYNTSGRFNSLEKIRNYLFKSVKNLAINHNRRVALHAHSMKELQGRLLQDEASSQWIDAEMLKFVILEIKGLPNPHRAVVELILQEGLSTRDIADRLGMTPNMVSKVKRAAIEKIRIFLIKKRLFDTPVLVTLAAAVWAVYASSGCIN
jgi:RNA polymerase sigma factor (sigma-70 family)